MVRHTILLAVVLGLWLGPFASICPGGPSEQAISEPAVAFVSFLHYDVR